MFLLPKEQVILFKTLKSVFILNKLNWFQILNVINIFIFHLSGNPIICVRAPNKEVHTVCRAQWLFSVTAVITKLFLIDYYNGPNPDKQMMTLVNFMTHV